VFDAQIAGLQLQKGVKRQETVLGCAFSADKN
jgi:hypothetical protein